MDTSPSPFGLPPVQPTPSDERSSPRLAPAPWPQPGRVSFNEHTAFPSSISQPTTSTSAASRPSGPMNPFVGSRPKRPWLLPTIISAVVILLLGGTVAAAKFGVLPFDLPFLTPKTESAVLSRMLDRLDEITSNESTAVFAFESQPRAENAVPIDLESIIAASGKTNAPVNASDFDDVFDSLPADLSARVDTSVYNEQATTASQLPNAELDFHGTFGFGVTSMTFSFAAKVVGSVGYVILKDIPPIVDISAIKDKWITITKESLEQSGVLSILGGYGAPEDFDQASLDQAEVEGKIAIEAMRQENIFIIDEAKTESLNDRKVKRFRLRLDPTRLAPFYITAATNIKAQFGSKATFPFDQALADNLAEENFIATMTEIIKGTTLNLWVDPSTAWPVKLDFRWVIVPPDSVEKLRDKQYVLSMIMAWDKINEVKTIEAPSPTIDFNEATRLISEQFLVGAALSNQNANRSAPGSNTNTNASVSVGATNANVSVMNDEDADGLTDIQEGYYRTDPDEPDSDGDGYPDGEEVANGYDPLGPGKLTTN